MTTCEGATSSIQRLCVCVCVCGRARVKTSIPTSLTTCYHLSWSMCVSERILNISALQFVVLFLSLSSSSTLINVCPKPNGRTLNNDMCQKWMELEFYQLTTNFNFFLFNSCQLSKTSSSAKKNCSRIKVPSCSTAVRTKPQNT